MSFCEDNWKLNAKHIIAEGEAIKRDGCRFRNQHARIMSKSVEINGLAKRAQELCGQECLQAEDRAGSTRSLAAASAEKASLEGDHLQCLLMLLLFSLVQRRAN